MFFQSFRLELLFSVNSLKQNTFFFWHVCAPIIGPTLCLHYLSLSDPFVFLLVNDEGVTHDWRESPRLKTTWPVYFPHLSRNIEFINNGANHTVGAPHCMHVSLRVSLRQEAAVHIMKDVLYLSIF